MTSDLQDLDGGPFDPTKKPVAPAPSAPPATEGVGEEIEAAIISLDEKAYHAGLQWDEDYSDNFQSYLVIRDGARNALRELLKRRLALAESHAGEVRRAAEDMLRLVEMVSAKDAHTAFCNGVHAPDGQCEGMHWLLQTTDALRKALGGAEEQK